MDDLWKEVLWNQFGATIDMFGNALKACPDELWVAPLWTDPDVGDKYAKFWYVAYHTLFWLDLYLTGTVEGFSPPEPYTLDELDPRGLLPERVYLKTELLSYLAHCRQKCRGVIEQLSDDKLHQVYIFPWRVEGLSYAELLVDNLRHVQEHGAQLNMLLGQQARITARWLAKARDEGTPLTG